MKSAFFKIFTKKVAVHKDNLVQIEDYSHLPECAYCKKPIFQQDQRKKYPRSGVLKATYHIKCFRLSLRQVKKMALNGTSANIMSTPINSAPNSL